MPIAEKRVCLEITFIPLPTSYLFHPTSDNDFDQPPPGVMQGVQFNVTINTTDDSVPERTEDFQMVLRVVSPSGLNVTTGAGNVSITVTITDNDGELYSS